MFYFGIVFWTIFGAFISYDFLNKPLNLKSIFLVFIGGPMLWVVFLFKIFLDCVELFSKIGAE